MKVWAPNSKLIAACRLDDQKNRVVIYREANEKTKRILFASGLAIKLKPEVRQIEIKGERAMVYWLMELQYLQQPLIMKIGE